MEHKTKSTLHSARRSARFSSRQKTVDKKVRTQPKHEEFQIRKSLYDHITEDMKKFNRSVYHQRIIIFGSNRVDYPNHKADNEDDAVKNFKTEFSEELDKILKKCRKRAFLKDKTSGILLCADDFTIIALEGPEEFFEIFLKQLAVVANEWWTTNRVFLLQDAIGENLLKCYASFRIVPKDTSDIFSSDEENDRITTAAQHFKTRQKLMKLFKKINNSIVMTESDRIPYNRKFENTFSSTYQILCDDDENDVNNIIKAEEFVQLLPEKSVLDRVLSSTQYYRTLQDYVNLIESAFTETDEDDLVWPVQRNYLPEGIFEKSKYDVNVIFSEYKDKLCEEMEGEQKIEELEEVDKTEEIKKKEKDLKEESAEKISVRKNKSGIKISGEESKLNIE